MGIRGPSRGHRALSRLLTRGGSAPLPCTSKEPVWPCHITRGHGLTQLTSPAHRAHRYACHLSPSRLLAEMLVASAGNMLVLLCGGLLAVPLGVLVLMHARPRPFVQLMSRYLPQVRLRARVRSEEA